MAPIHATHKRHVVCGRVCLHESLFDSFVRRRNGDREAVREWAAGVLGEWTGGAHANDEPGDEFEFWRTRYAEKWPAADAAAPKHARPTPPWYKPAPPKAVNS